MLVGLVSDTHGTLPGGVARVFSGCQRILHAGDVGSLEVLRELESIAPTDAVAGNMDGALTGVLDELLRVTLAGANVIVAHRLEDALRAHRASPADVLVVGHTHVPMVERREGVLVVNPGSVSRPRSAAGATVGVLEIAADGVSARIVAV
ncbi:MAG: metallophosphoesterase family protein [Anaerosomatales bacterium]|nr:metallophosphoesterase family protein [Anaerosomatales bacterium]